MSHEQIHERLKEVFRNVFDDPALTVDESTTAADVEAWDSLAHVELIVAVEREFRVRFSTKEVKSLATVGDLMQLIEKRAQ